MSAKDVKKAAANTSVKKEGDARMPFTRENYVLMAAGFILIVLGFILMSGGADNDPAVFDAERLYSFRRITLAPILVLAGFAVELVAIMRRPKAGKENKE